VELLTILAENIAAKNYIVIVSEDYDSTGKSIFLARTPELYGCMAQGSSIEEAKSNLKDARVDYIYSLLKDNLGIPAPTQIIYTAVISSSNLNKNEYNLTRTIPFRKGVSESKPLYTETLTK